MVWFMNPRCLTHISLKESKMSYTFKYLRADRQEVEMKPSFDTSEEAERGRQSMISVGAVCSEVYLIEKTSPAITSTDDYFEKKISQFNSYLEKELEVIVHEGVKFNIVYGYLLELPERILRFVRGNAPYIPKMAEGGLFDRLDRQIYLVGVSEKLMSRAQGYSPMDGSVPEDIGKILKNLSVLILSI